MVGLLWVVAQVCPSLFIPLLMLIAMLILRYLGTLAATGL